MRLSIGLDIADEDTARRAEVAPAQLLDAGLLRPTRAEPMRLSIADVVLMLRAAVDLAQFDDPSPATP